MALRKLQLSRALVIGLALFSMFFGSGNLIFPLAVGVYAGQACLWATLGFLLTAVCLPFLGVLAMVVYEGDYQRFFQFLGKPLGFIAIFLLLTFWIPLGSGPRCVLLSYASLSPFLGETPSWLYGLAYSALVFLLSIQKQRMISILGYILTPLLLLSLALVIGKGLVLLPALPASLVSAESGFYAGLLQGYNTMDLIASFFFSATIVSLLKGHAPQSPKGQKAALGLALHAGLIAGLILATVYIGLILVAAGFGPALASTPKEKLLPELTNLMLGHEWGGLAAAVISLACLTTSVALAAVFNDFLYAHIFKRKLASKACLLFTCTLSYGMSVLGFETICQLTEPAFKVFYPSLVLMIVVLLPLQWRQNVAAMSPSSRSLS